MREINRINKYHSRTEEGGDAIDHQLISCKLRKSLCALVYFAGQDLNRKGRKGLSKARPRNSLAKRFFPAIMLDDVQRNQIQTTRKRLLIDADDTLWENNIYFERAIANFISFLNHHEYSPEQVREVLNQVERESIVTHGYGLHSFAHSLVQTFERLAVEPITPALHETIHGFAHTIAGHPVEIMKEWRKLCNIYRSAIT